MESDCPTDGFNSQLLRVTLRNEAGHLLNFIQTPIADYNPMLAIHF